MRLCASSTHLWYLAVILFVVMTAIILTESPKQVSCETVKSGTNIPTTTNKPAATTTVKPSKHAEQKDESVSTLKPDKTDMDSKDNPDPDDIEEEDDDTHVPYSLEILYDKVRATVLDKKDVPIETWNLYERTLKTVQDNYYKNL